MKFHAASTPRALPVVLLLCGLGGGGSACTVSFEDIAVGSDAVTDARPDVSGLQDAAVDPTDAGRDGQVDAGPDAGPDPDAALIQDAAVDAGCPPGSKWCTSACVDVDSPATGCAAASCAPCAFDHAAALCVAGACALGTCENLWGNCDANSANGCEADLANDLEHCGACGDACALPHAQMQCQATNCNFVTCDDNYENCDSNLWGTGCETGVLYNNDHCGHCNNDCYTGFNCNNGACRCSNDGECDTGGGGTCEPTIYHLCQCPTTYCLYGPCDTDGVGCL